MTEVRFRSEVSATSAHLANVPLDALDSVIPVLKAWGIEPFAMPDLFGQFVYDEDTNSIYFEVVQASGGDE